MKSDAAFAVVLELMLLIRSAVDRHPPKSGWAYWVYGYMWDKKRSVWSRVLIALSWIAGWFLLFVAI